MTSAKKIRSNRANSLKSTGPSPENWWISSANSLKHGLFARRPVLSEKDRAVLEQFSKQIYAELQPVGPSETYYVEDFIDQMGRLRQSLKIETGLYELYRVYQGSQRDIGVAFAHDASQGGCLTRLMKRYALGFERAMRKDLAELRKLQADRAEPSVPSKDLDALPGSEPTKGESTAPGVAIYIAQPVAAIAQPLPASPGQPTATRITTHVIHVAPLKFLSTAVLLSDEDATQFDDYLDSLFTEWQPQSVTKAIFVELFGVTTWRLGRLSRVDAELLEQYRFHNNVDGGLLTGFVHDVANMDCLSKVGECENKLRNSLSKILKELLN